MTLQGQTRIGRRIALAAGENEARGPGHPPVNSWNPPYCGELDIRIASDGKWYYLGTPIARERLVRLFASVLRRDQDGRFYLVTPVERLAITVDDAPFVAVALEARGAGQDRSLTFRTNLGDAVTAGRDHSVRFVEEPETEGLKAYLNVRGRLEALVSRTIMYDLVELGCEHVEDGERRFGVWSEGAFFAMAPADAVSAA